MNYTTKRNISLVIVFILVAAALGIFFGLDWPAFKRIGELNRKISQEKTQYEDQYQAVQIAKTIINQYKSLTGVSQTISMSIPRDTEIQNILAQINSISTQSGLTVQSINFETLSSQTNSKEIVKGNKTVQIDASLLGTYEGFKTWLSALESNIRLMDMTKINFTGLAGSESLKSQGVFNFKVSFNVYYQ
jgi:Tfp pilus assembly protein PilO